MKLYSQQFKEAYIIKGKFNLDFDPIFDGISDLSEKFFNDKKNVIGFKNLVTFFKKPYKPTEIALDMLNRIIIDLPDAVEGTKTYQMLKTFSTNLANNPDTYKREFRKFEGPSSVIAEYFSLLKQAVMYYANMEENVGQFLQDEYGIDEKYAEAIVNLMDDENFSQDDIQSIDERNGAVYAEIGGGEWVFADESTADELAKDYIQSTIDDMGADAFTSGFVENHIDTDKLGRDLSMDDNFEFDRGYDEPDMFLGDEEPAGEDGDWTDEQRERAGELARDEFNERVSDDPIGYLEDIYGSDWKSNFDITNYIDWDDVIDEAIRSDGRGHFIATYDGDENEYQGIYYYRTN